MKLYKFLVFLRNIYNIHSIQKMKPKNNLHTLIRSLTRNEKRYFSLLTSLDGRRKIYVKLFNEIDSQKVYNENLIKEKFRNEKFIKQLTFTKNYLYKQIIKVLIIYNGDKSVDTKLNSLIEQSNILFDKALYNDFKNTIQEGKRISEKYERFDYMLKFLQMEKIWIYRKITKYDIFHEVFKQESDAMLKLSNINQYLQLASVLEENYRERGLTRLEEESDFLNKVEEMLLIKDGEQALTARAKELRYFILQLIEDTKGNFEKLLYYSKKRMEIVKNDPFPFTGYNLNYFHDILFYIILTSIRINRSANVQNYFRILKLHTGSSVNDNISLFLIDSASRILQVFKEKNWAKGVELAKSIEKVMAEHRGKIEYDFEILFNYNFATIYFMKGMYSDSLKFLNYLINNPGIALRKDQEFNSKILFLIVHYELNNFDLLEHLIKSTYRYLLKRKKLFKFETILLRFFRKISSFKRPGDFIDGLVLLKKELIKLRADPFESKAFSYFDFIHWIETKIKKA